jgi:cell division septum initiation protein DivIVA
MKQPATMREATSMVKERLLDRRVDKLAQENEKLREEVDELRHDLDAEQGRSKETLTALSKSRKRPGRMKWLVLAGGAYVLGAKAGRARYEQLKGWARSVTRSNGDQMSDTSVSGTTTLPPTSGV